METDKLQELWEHARDVYEQNEKELPENYWDTYLGAMRAFTDACRAEYGEDVTIVSLTDSAGVLVAGVRMFL